MKLWRTLNNDITNLSNEFKLFKIEMQHQLVTFREYFLENRNDQHVSKDFHNLDSRLPS